jgi:hypothetical protein
MLPNSLRVGADGNEVIVHTLKGPMLPNSQYVGAGVHEAVIHTLQGSTTAQPHELAAVALHVAARSVLLHAPPRTAVHAGLYAR